MFTPKQRVRHKTFTYEPRFYNPERDERIKRRMRIKSKTHRVKSPGFLRLAILLILALLVYLQLV